MNCFELMQIMQEIAGKVSASEEVASKLAISSPDISSIAISLHAIFLPAISSLAISLLVIFLLATSLLTLSLGLKKKIPCFRFRVRAYFKHACLIFFSQAKLLLWLYTKDHWINFELCT